MSGAVSFVLGLLGLGTAAGVGVAQDIGINKKRNQVAGVHCWEGDTETLKMRRRVYDEWMRINMSGPNCLGKWAHEYPTGRYLHSKYRYWFKAHLDAKGIPYDDEILDEVSGVNLDRNNIALMYNTGKKHCGWF